MRPDDRQQRAVAQGLEESAAIFDPLVEGLSDAIRRGGRILLFAEGSLQHMARYLAPEVLGRRHKNGLQLSVDVLDASSGDPQAIARRCGPFDAILAIATVAEDPLFCGVIESAKARGAKIFCLCTGRARLETRVTVAVDAFESRPHYMPGHLSLILHFVSKRTLGILGANPLIKPTRLDDGPPRPLAQSSSGAPKADSLSASTSGTHPGWGKLVKEAPAAAEVEAPVATPAPLAANTSTSASSSALLVSTGDPLPIALSAPTPPPQPPAIGTPTPLPGAIRAGSVSARVPTIVPPRRAGQPDDAVPGEGSQSGRLRVPSDRNLERVPSDRNLERVPSDRNLERVPSDRNLERAPAEPAPEADPAAGAGRIRITSEHGAVIGEGSQSARLRSVTLPPTIGDAAAAAAGALAGAKADSGRVPPAHDSGRAAAAHDSGRAQAGAGTAARADSGRTPAKGERPREAASSADSARLRAQPGPRPASEPPPPPPPPPPADARDDEEATVDVSELIIDLEPDEKDLRLVSENASALLEGARSRVVAEEGAAGRVPPPIARDESGRVTLIQFRCKDCREPVVAAPSEAGKRARCPFCGRRVKVPRHGGRHYRMVEASISQDNKPVSLQFSLDACRLTIATRGAQGARIEAKIEDVSPEGIDATLDAALAGRLDAGGQVDLVIETPAFLEPLTMPATVERVLAPLPGPDGQTGGRARALLPLAEGAPREVKQKLARLCELRTTAAAGGPPLAAKPLALEEAQHEGEA